MLKIFVTCTFLVLTSCSIFQRKPESTALSPEDQRIRAVIYNVDQKIKADYSKQNKRSFTKFTQEEYERRLKPLKASRAEEMRDLYPIFKTKEFVAHPNTFVFCGFSERLGIAFCDDANCNGTEFFERTESADIIANWKQQLPAKCNEKK